MRAAASRLARDADAAVGTILFLKRSDWHDRIVIQALAERLAFALPTPITR